MMAAAGAIIATAAAGAMAPDAGAAKRKKAPVVTSIAPTSVAVGQTLQIRGKYFRRGAFKNTVAFKRDSGKAVFVKAEVATKKLIRVTIPERLTEQMAVRDGSPIPTPFRLRVLAKRFGKKFTSGKLIPLVGPELPPAPEKPAVDPDGDCDSDGVANRDDADKDNDLLLDDGRAHVPARPVRLRHGRRRRGRRLRVPLGARPQQRRVPERQHLPPVPRRDALPEPARLGRWLGLRRRLPHAGRGACPLEAQLADGSSKPTASRLTPVRPRSPTPTACSTRSTSSRAATGRRPALPAVGYAKETEFKTWLQQNGYWNIHWVGGGTRNILDFNGDGVVSETVPPGNYVSSEAHYLDSDGNGWLSDDERDEDADGLSNFDESHGRMQPGWWTGVYTRETPFHIGYLGTRIDDPDSDGDNVRDGADDQDHDDVPNISELSRLAIVGGTRGLDPSDLKAELGNPDPAYGRVHPFNPCMPFIDSRTCPRHIDLGSRYAPFDGPPGWRRGAELPGAQLAPPQHSNPSCERPAPPGVRRFTPPATRRAAA